MHHFVFIVSSMCLTICLLNKEVFPSVKWSDVFIQTHLAYANTRVNTKEWISLSKRSTSFVKR